MKRVCINLIRGFSENEILNFFQIKMTRRLGLLEASSLLLTPPLQSTHDLSHHYHPFHKDVQEVIVSMLALTLVAALCLYFKKRVGHFTKKLWTRKGSFEAEKLSLRRFQWEELLRATKNFSPECLIGSGAFGNVYRGNFESEGTLAIKKSHNESRQSVEEFRNEVKLLAKVKHKNLVSLVGICEDAGAKRSKVLVYEYVPNGSLLDYITCRGRRSLTWKQRVNIAIGAAKGIAHLHEGIKPGIIHRDVKPSNILVGEDFEAKVSDFGLVKMGPTGDKSHVSTQIKGTPGYLDPAYFSSFHLTPFSDVYSFGVILLQLIAARPAVEMSKKHSSYHIIDWATPSLERGNVEEILDANLLMEPCNMEIMLKMGRLGLRCVAKSPKERPTMTQVWQELEAALRTTNNIIHRDPSRGSQRSTFSFGPSTDHGSLRSRSTEDEYSESFVSIDGIGLQRFHVEMDSLSFQSTSLRCIDTSSISFDVDKSDLTRTYEQKATQGQII